MREEQIEEVRLNCRECGESFLAFDGRRFVELRDWCAVCGWSERDGLAMQAAFARE